MISVKLLHGDLKKQLVWCKRAQVGLLAALLVFFGVMYLGCIRPEDNDLDTVRQRYATAQSELQQNQDQAKSLPRVELEIQHLQQRVERFDKKLPKQQDLAQFINDVTHISDAASLRKLSWHLDSKPRQAQQFNELPIEFTFEGDFQTGIVQFLHGTEDMSRLTRVRKLDLKTIDSSAGQVRAQLTMNIYFGGDE